MAKRIIIQNPRNYLLWYVPQFEIARITTTPLEVPYSTPERLKMVEDIRKRGLINPVCISNHDSVSRRPGPRPYYLKIGYNRLWACKYLNWVSFPALVAEKDHCPLPGAVEMRSAVDVHEVWQGYADLGHYRAVL